MSISPNIKKPILRTNDDDALEFLPAALEIAETPPRPLGRLLAVVISVFFVLVVIWAALSPIDIVAVAEGRVVPSGQIKIVQPFQSGVVNTIHVREGTHVNEGDILIELDATEPETNRMRLELELARAELDRTAAAALLTNDPIGSFVAPDNVDQRLAELSATVLAERWKSYRSILDENAAEHQRIESSIHALEAEESAFSKTVAEFVELNNTAVKLDAVGLSTRSQLANMRLQLISTENQLQNVTQSIAQTKLDLVRNQAQRRQITATFLGDVNTQMAEARQAILVASQELERLREREALYFLRAPVSGTVNEILIHTIGAVVSPSERLLTIVPDGVSMEIEASLANKDIGFVEINQLAEIKLEAFPFTHFGVLNATVTHISPDAIIDPDRGPIFAIRITPAPDALITGNSQIHLSPGMRATAEIKTGHRTVLEFFLTPLLRYRDEAIRER